MHEVIRAALDRGLKVDVGHGSHFSYRLARKALDAGIVPDTLGADMHGYNTYVPPPPGTPSEHPDDEAHPFAGQAKFSLTQAMSSMLALGLTMEQVVPMVTTNAAAMIGMSDEIGIAAGRHVADVSVLVRPARPFHPAGQRKDAGRGGTSAAAAVLPARRQALRRQRRHPAGGGRCLIRRHRQCGSEVRIILARQRTCLLGSKASRPCPTCALRSEEKTFMIVASRYCCRTGAFAGESHWRRAWRASAGGLA